MICLQPGGDRVPIEPSANCGSDLAARARKWVEESCAAQGIPVMITDPTTIRYVAEILRQGRNAREG